MVEARTQAVQGENLLPTVAARKGLLSRDREGAVWPHLALELLQFGTR